MGIFSSCNSEYRLPTSTTWRRYTMHVSIRHHRQKVFDDNIRNFMGLLVRFVGLGITDHSQNLLNYYFRSGRNVVYYARIIIPDQAGTWFITLPLSDYGFTCQKVPSLMLCKIWMASSTTSFSLRSKIRACSKLITRWFSLNLAWWGNRYHCWTFEWSLSRGSEVCLKPIPDDVFSYRTANKERMVKLGIGAERRDRQRAFLDVMVFNPLAQSYRDTPLSQCYRRNELEKRRVFDERIREVVHGFSSLPVFSLVWV